MTTHIAHNPHARSVAFDRKFQAEIGRLMARIEMVPAEYRAALHCAADTAQQQHERLQATGREIRQMVAEIDRMIAHTKSQAEACLRELETGDIDQAQSAGRSSQPCTTI